MSNSSTTALSLASRSSSGSRMRMISIGKDSQPVNLPNMSSMNDHSWKKAASFETLRRCVYSLKDDHTVADLISLISGELPQDTGSAFQEAQSAAQAIVAKATLISNLEPTAFLTSTGKTVGVEDATDLENRPEDITYLRFNFFMNGESIDHRVKNVNPLSVYFYLKLPQYIYDVEAKTATPVIISQNPPVNNPVAKLLSSIFQASSTPPSTPRDQT